MTTLRAASAVALALTLAAVPAAQAATKAKPKPITKTYTMELLPAPYPAQGDSCTDPRLEGIAMHTETLQTKGAGMLAVSVTGFTGDWDITIADASGATLMVGSGTTTGGGAPAQNGTDTATLKIKKAAKVLIRTCNFAGSQKATGKYVFTYK